jgi:hypothetical protein
MKTIKLITIIAVMALSSLWGCKKRGNDVITATAVINVLYPVSYSPQNAENVEVKLVSKADGTETKVKTDAAGNANFSDLIPGFYDISVSKSLTAQEALALTGISSAITLNVIKNNVNIQPTMVNNVSLRLAGSAVGSLVIKEVYYTGSSTPSGGTYFSDQFVEIYNNSTDTIFLDNLCIADIFGVSGLINPSSVPTPFKDDQANVYANNVWRIPGTGKQRPLAPGKSIVIAQDGVNHKEATLNPNSPVDLSAAEWETFNERPDNRDADAPNVPNLEKLYFTGGFDWLMPVFGPSLIIFKIDNFNTLEKSAIPGSTLPERIKIPNSMIIDSFEALRDASSGSYKRIPTALDAGFVFATSTYTGESFIRKTSSTIGGRRVLQDTNNTTNDFIKLSTPKPKGF